jgi:hypothetical protein
MHGIVWGVAVSAAVAVVLIAAATILSFAARWSWLDVLLRRLIPVDP